MPQCQQTMAEREGNVAPFYEYVKPLMHLRAGVNMATRDLIHVSGGNSTNKNSLEVDGAIKNRTNFSVAFSFMYDADALVSINNGDQTLVSLGIPDSNTNGQWGFALRIPSDAHVNGDHLRWQIHDGTTSTSAQQTTASAKGLQASHAPARWNHVVLAFDGADRGYLWLNGYEDSTYMEGLTWVTTIPVVGLTWRLMFARPLRNTHPWWGSQSAGTLRYGFISVWDGETLDATAAAALFNGGDYARYDDLTGWSNDDSDIPDPTDYFSKFSSGEPFNTEVDGSGRQLVYPADGTSPSVTPGKRVVSWTDDIGDVKYSAKEQQQPLVGVTSSGNQSVYFPTADGSYSSEANGREWAHLEAEAPWPDSWEAFDYDGHVELYYVERSSSSGGGDAIFTLSRDDIATEYKFIEYDATNDVWKIRARNDALGSDFTVDLLLDTAEPREELIGIVTISDVSFQAPGYRVNINGDAFQLVNANTSPTVNEDPLKASYPDSIKSSPVRGLNDFADANVAMIGGLPRSTTPRVQNPFRGHVVDVYLGGQIGDAPTNAQLGAMVSAMNSQYGVY